MNTISSEGIVFILLLRIVCFSTKVIFNYALSEFDTWEYVEQVLCICTKVNLVVRFFNVLLGPSTAFFVRSDFDGILSSI